MHTSTLFFMMKESKFAEEYALHAVAPGIKTSLTSLK